MLIVFSCDRGIFSVVDIFFSFVSLRADKESVADEGSSEHKLVSIDVADAERSIAHVSLFISGFVAEISVGVVSMGDAMGVVVDRCIEKKIPTTDAADKKNGGEGGGYFFC